MQKFTINSLLKESVNQYPDNKALSFIDEPEVTYRELGENVARVSTLLKKLGITPGDKVALIGENSPNWGISYLSAVCSKAVIVPVLPDFHSEEVISIINHSESKLVFASLKQYKRLQKELYETGLPVIITDNFRLAGSGENSSLSDAEADFSCSEAEEEDLAAIIYTSGTTGSSKGVMLTHRNISWTVQQCLTIQDIRDTDRFLSILPMSHTYENTLGFLLPLHRGASVYYLRKQPTPTILVQALSRVRPTLILTVPLIIEKIYRKQVLPKLTGKSLSRMLFNFGPTRVLMNRMAGKKLLNVFGGQLKFFGIGGAKLDPAIEKYLLEAGFPYAIGYGLTETSPLLAGSRAGKTKWQSTGNAMEGVSLRIHEPNEKTGEGEIQAKGPNVMKGYYKNPEATANVFTDDGWFRTGDLGYIDKKGVLYIRGRLKNVILGTNGENIYPEEIESIINSIEGVEESLVVQKQGKLVAMVNINIKELENRIIRLNERVVKVQHEKADELMVEIQNFVNQRVNRFSRLQMVVMHATPFEKTPTNKIKRYLYGG